MSVRSLPAFFVCRFLVMKGFPRQALQKETSVVTLLVELTEVTCGDRFPKWAQFSGVMECVSPLPSAVDKILAIPTLTGPLRKNTNATTQSPRAKARPRRKSDMPMTRRMPVAHSATL